ncbi:MAG: long-chain fatty acid--CoA ligase, partial [Acidimicrobiia bacterium]|nr:long-chain fatty acid--CoA ligase [Acidimicrobiia bacterium]
GATPPRTPRARKRWVNSGDGARGGRAAPLTEGLRHDGPTLVLAAHEDLVAPELVTPELPDVTRSSSAPAPEALPDDPHRLVAVVFTSGTTGEPKAAEFTAGALAAIGRIDAGDDWDGGPPMLCTTSFAHVGFMTKLPWYLRRGGTLHLLDRWRPDAVIAAIERFRLPSLGGVAAQLELVLRSPELDGADLGCLRSVVMGGAASPPRLVRHARDRLGVAYSIRYSSTESGGVGTATAFDAPDDEALHTVGRPRPGVEVTGVDDDGRRSPPGVVGQLCLRSPTLMSGYRHRPDATAAVLVDGWLHTGDLGAQGEDGTVTVTGRIDDRYIRGGYNIDPTEVEAALADHPLVDQLVVVARPDEVMGAIGVAVVVAHRGSPAPDLESLRRHAGDRLARWKLPEDLVVIAQLPMTAADKVDRRALASVVTPDR